MSNRALCALALVAGVIAAILELIDKHQKWVILLLIAAVILLAADGLWGWYGSRRGTATRA